MTQDYREIAKEYNYNYRLLFAALLYVEIDDFELYTGTEKMDEIVYHAIDYYLDQSTVPLDEVSRALYLSLENYLDEGKDITKIDNETILDNGLRRVY